MTAPITVESATGSIYDLGYRGYEGPRLGRGHAIRSLFTHSLKSTFGIGRGARAKIAPLALGAMAVVPAVAFVGILALAARFGEGTSDLIEANSPFGYHTYFGTMSTFVILFCAAQAPELFGRDQRHGVLSLYFARALRRSDYTLARIAGFVTALLILQLFPQTVLFLGRVLLAPDVVAKIGDDVSSIPPILVQGLLSSLLLGGLAMAVSAFTPRRAYATAGIIALFVIPSIVAGVVAGIGSTDVGNVLFLLSPTSVLDGTNAVLFDIDFASEFFFINLPDWSYFAAAIAGIVGSIAITLRRFAKVTA
ncbi:MAG TPA: ABC transporter permease subunit [Candidatus Limnocylindrales bacterium]|nr:ABC transporter permease subunit [Candidatus Limnocylindrales bacterium]